MAINGSGVTESNPLFQIAGSTMVVLNNGNVGIGTTAPGQQLTIKAGIAPKYALGVYADSAGRGMLVGNPDLAAGVGSYMGTSFGGGSGDTYTSLQAYNTGGNSMGNLVLQQSGGNVGIGTTGPSERLHVAGNVLVSTAAVSPILFVSTTTGNVGIGTTNPGEKLVVAGNLRTVVGGDSTGILAYDAAVGGSHLSSLTRQTNNLSISSYDGIGLAPGATGGPSVSYALFAKTGGNVGIGTTAPGYKLQVSGSIYGGFADNDVPNAGDGTLIGGGGYWSLRPAVNHSFNIDVYNGGSSTAAMTVLQNGNVGIGTTSPGYKLDVNGDMNLAAGSVYRIGGVEQSGTSKWTLGAGNDIYRNLGNVGIGTTSPGTALSVVGAIQGDNLIRSTGGSTNGSGAGAEILMSDGLASFWGYNRTTAADVAVQVGRAGAATTINGSTVSFMSGNVGIGTTGPSERLHVAGNVLVSTAAVSPILFVSTTTGNVGIGTAGPGSLLTLDGTSAYAIQLNNSGASKTLLGQAFAADNYIAGSAANDFIARSNGANMLFSTDSGATAQLYLKNGGNVGIGTTNPNTQFEVAGVNPRIRSAGSVWGALSLGDTGATSGQQNFDIRSDNGVLSVHSITDNYSDYVAQNILGIKYNGNVGIGTAAPTEKLHITGSGARILIDGDGAHDVTLGSSNTSASLNLDSSGATGSFVNLKSNGAIQWLIGTGFSGDLAKHLHFYPYGGGGVGIGAFTSAPASLLDVYGNMSIGSYAGVTAAPANGMIISGNVGIGTTQPSERLHVAGNVLVSTAAVSPILFVSTTTGNVGIGTAYPEQLLYVEKSNIPSDAYPDKGGNAAYNTSADYDALVLSRSGKSLLGPSLYMRGTDTDIGHAFSARLSVHGYAFNDGYGDFAISTSRDWNMSERFRITSAGNVGIGTSNPVAKLHVSVSAASATEALRLENLGAGGQQSSINFSGVGGGGVTSLYGGPPNTLSGQSGFALKLSDNSGNANNFIVADGESYSNYLAFWTGSSAVATNTEKMRITKDGNVGIGTTTPGSMLTVQAGDVQTRGAGNGFIMKDASNANCYKVYMSAGVLTTTVVACP